MITNSREYRTSRTQLAKLTETLAEAESRGPVENVHPDLHKAELMAIASEAERIATDLKAYEELVEGRRVRFEAVHLEDLPVVLIQARIASQLSQKQLAERLGLHEQQVQRYEATQYRGASFDRLLQVARVLGLQIDQDVLLPVPILRRALKHLSDLGLPDKFIRRRVLPSDSTDEDGAAASASPSLERLGHVFGWTLDQLVAMIAPPIPSTAAGGALYKLAAGRNTTYLEAYTAYAYRVACGAAVCASHLPIKPVPQDAREARRQLLKNGPLTLRRIVEWAWELGVVVLPLQDRAAFHGAFWRINGRNVIIIKQKTSSAERQMHDLLHELYHASQEPELPSRAVLDRDAPENSRDREEEEAATYASDVLLDGRANELAMEVAREAGKFGPALKSSVQRVATRAGVSAGVLANHLAWVLSRQPKPIEWWGAANNLQEQSEAHLDWSRQTAFERLIPPGEDNVDADLLFRALRDDEEVL
ncbi:MAG TPA: XRE family transcriptional regulator [Myxococcaceae bacterium]|nr:XRE family transcriptional regulator [Myxococcaceae bacterium]